MGLPIHTRAAALAAALSTTSYIIVTIAEIGHPPPDAQGIGAFLTSTGPRAVPVATVTPQPREDLERVAAEMPQP